MFHLVFKTSSRRIKSAVAGSILAPSAYSVIQILKERLLFLEQLKKIPGVDTLLNNNEIKELTSAIDIEFVKYIIREVLGHIKNEAKNGKFIPDLSDIINQIISKVHKIKSKTLKKVINATGIIIHTNLGRAPYSEEMLADTFNILTGYNNLEFDLNKASRGSRNLHASELLKYLCGAEDVLVVNNNAAAVMLILRAFAKEKEVIISRGELIEIGGSFRLPDIIAASDCKMNEVGTTNKTKVSDYENAINENTGVLFKAHKSNYSIEGFTHEVKLKELVLLGKKKNIPVVYDMGSGLLNNRYTKELKNEPSVIQTLKTGVGLVCFSGDKLLGGPQAGIIAGKKELIQKLKKEPLLRALRVDKLTLAFLETNCNYFLDEKILNKKNLFYNTINQQPIEIENKAKKLQQYLSKYDIESEVVASKGQFGGGALPGSEIDSFAVKIKIIKDTSRQKSIFAENLYKNLLQQNKPLLGILRKGNIYFDVLTLQERELEFVAELISDVYKLIT